MAREDFTYVDGPGYPLLRCAVCGWTVPAVPDDAEARWYARHHFHTHTPAPPADADARWATDHWQYGADAAEPRFPAAPSAPETADAPPSASAQSDAAADADPAAASDAHDRATKTPDARLSDAEPAEKSAPARGRAVKE